MAGGIAYPTTANQAVKRRWDRRFRLSSYFFRSPLSKKIVSCRFTIALRTLLPLFAQFSQELSSIIAHKVLLTNSAFRSIF
jgi:hypothetical protein